MFGLGTQELLIILVIALFIFGGKKLPEIGAGLGKGLRSFKQGLKEIDLEKEEKGEEGQASTERQSSPEGPSSPKA
ncbi:MAG: twin-arginine translocase TatA/TatE family subunit [Deltaproteobacteria bacterium]